MPAEAVNQDTLQKLFGTAVRFSESCPPALGAAASFLALALVATLDILVIRHVDLAIPYAFPVVIAAWLPPRHLWVAMVPASATIWTFIQVFSGGEPQVVAGTLLVRVTTLGLLAGVFVLLRQQSQRAIALALNDDLTGIANRRQLLQRLELEIAKSRRTGAPMSVLLADIDRFKQVNDTLGHDEGDRLLIAAAKALSDAFRRTDLVSRLGGDEFAILLPETNAAAATLLAHRAIAAMRSGLVSYGSDVSLGIATFVEPPASPDAALKAADEIMYAAKKGSGGGLATAEA